MSSPRDKPRPVARPFSSILVAMDLTAQSLPAVARAVRLPLREGARVTLLHAIPAAVPASSRRRVRADAVEAMRGAMASAGRGLDSSVSVSCLAVVGDAAATIADAVRDHRPELLVLGRGAGHALRDVFLGSTAERVIRQARVPVLAVRASARSAYRRPMVALDLDEAAAGVLAMFRRVVAPPRPATTVVHAYDAPFHDLLYSSLSSEESRASRERSRLRAAARLERLLRAEASRARAARDEPLRWSSVLRCGSARLVIPAAAARARADLVLLGTRARAGLAHAMLGTVAGDVLRELACDVLVVPPAREGAWRA